MALMNINWEKKIQIDVDWIERELVTHFNEKKTKLSIRGFTPKASGNLFSCNSLIDEMYYFIIDYVHSTSYKDRVRESLINKYDNDKLAEQRLDIELLSKAMSFFGQKNPDTDGKYGEILLFALVESILKSKMVGHKIKSLSNPKDQVKGGDGIFMGNYEVEKGKFKPALLIGESKIMQGTSDAIYDAFDSINRFHKSSTQKGVNDMELIVAHNNLFIDNSDVDYDEIYELLSPNTDKYKSQVLVHPILIMHNSQKINTIEEKATDNEDIERRIKEWMIKEKVQYLKKINDKLKSFPDVKKVYLEFFFFPFNDIKKFRDGMYYKIHGVEYPYSS